MRQPRISAVLIATIVGLSVLAGGGYATDGQPTTEISQCTSIDEPGHYELTTDLAYSTQYDDGCIDVTADDVTIDGNGHAIAFDESDRDTLFRGPAIAVQARENVTVHNVTIGEYSHVEVTNSTAVTLENVVFVGDLTTVGGGDITVRSSNLSGGVEIHNGDGVTLTDNRLGGGSFTIAGPESANVTVRDNVGDGLLSVTVRSGEATVVNNTLRASTHPETIHVAGYDGTYVTVARNYAGNGQNGIRVKSNGVARVANNTIEEMSNIGLGVGGTSDDVVVRHNEVTDADRGVVITGGYEAGPAVTLERNVVTNNRIGVKTFTNIAEVHWNDLSANAEFGVVYTQEHGSVNATRNYWGGTPASPNDADAPFEDPVTEALANGAGAAVSEGTAPAGAEQGVSNVHFDPWLDTAPTAGVVERPSDGGDTDGQTNDGTDEQTDDSTDTQTDDGTTDQPDDEGTAAGQSDDGDDGGTDAAGGTDCDGQADATGENCPTDVTSTEASTGTGVSTGTKVQPATSNTEASVASVTPTTDSDAGSDGFANTGIPGLGVGVSVIALVVAALLVSRRV